MQVSKKQARIRRSIKARMKIKSLKAIRLSVFKSNQHIYAQLINPEGQVLAVASTCSKEYAEGKKLPMQKAAEWVGTEIAKKAKAAGVSAIAFDRSGYPYHGCVKSLAEAARAAGLEF